MKSKHNEVVIHRRLSEEIAERDEQIKMHSIKTTAQRIGAIESKKTVKKKTLLMLLSSVSPDYQRLINSIDQGFQGLSHKHQTEADKRIKEQEDTRVKEEDERLNRQLTEKRGNLHEAAANYRHEVVSWQRKLWILYVISSAEVLLNFKAFALLGGNLISTIGLAVLSATLIFWYSHLVPGWIDKYSQGIRIRRNLFFIISIVPIGVVFYLFGYARMTYITILNPNQDFLLNPLIFCTINVFAYGINYWIIKEYRPSPQKRKDYANYKRDKKIIDGLDKEVLALRKKQQQREQEFLGRELDRKSCLLLAKQLENEVVTRYHGCYDTLKMELVIRNADLTTVFDKISHNDLPPLKLNYQNL